VNCRRVRGSITSDAQHSGKAAFEEASTKLDEGLKTCRAVVENYRSMLALDQQRGGHAEVSDIALNAETLTAAIGDKEEPAPMPE
jgi:hypothetical protein